MLLGGFFLISSRSVLETLIDPRLGRRLATGDWAIRIGHEPFELRKAKPRAFAVLHVVWSLEWQVLEQRFSLRR